MIVRDLSIASDHTFCPTTLPYQDSDRTFFSTVFGCQRASTNIPTKKTAFAAESIVCTLRGAPFVAPRLYAVKVSLHNWYLYYNRQIAGVNPVRVSEILQVPMYSK
jgi:hypothetical protein